jgi:allophanate hydrolase subunit 2
LKAGDVLTLRRRLDSARLDELEQELWKIKIYLPAILGLIPRSDIRVMRGPHTALFTDTSINDFLTTAYRIGPQSERMGYRLEGARLSMKSSKQLLSEATSFGSIQVPPDGNPIVLMADRQTTGGYPKIAHVATVDLPVIAQCMPGETLRFTETTLAQAQQLDNQREEAFERLCQTLKPLRQLFEG